MSKFTAGAPVARSVGQCRRFLHILVRVRRRSSRPLTSRLVILRSFSTRSPRLSSHISPPTSTPSRTSKTILIRRRDSPTRFIDWPASSRRDVSSSAASSLVPSRDDARAFGRPGKIVAHILAPCRYFLRRPLRGDARARRRRRRFGTRRVRRARRGRRRRWARARRRRGRRGHLERLLHGGLRLLNARRIRLIHSALRLLDRFLRGFEILAEPSSPREGAFASRELCWGGADDAVDEVIVDVIETSLSRLADDLVRGAQTRGFAARAAVAARDAPLAAGSAALGTNPASGGERGVHVLAVAIAEAHAAEGDGESSAAAVRGGAHHVRLDRLLAAPVARRAELGVVDARADAEAAARVVARPAMARSFAGAPVRFVGARRRAAARSSSSSRP